ncbi:MAG: FeoA family protein [Candidatus Omnitrophota bacterium]|nr:ferrous iron transport protein A [Candidatus Omnitrophota bacterium]MBU1928635.1 ferrous iron transport protein A [Candidatus Omnitrophota bacterium]MBU2034747.1 ferrous iron transport protein A [Candidatus Omnitrophota bacterium]MBU2222077.1 ferrous iron transport protein A [Candidatus Omnitrophota bacterium]MBU2258582.1 ferrous iron transport protein A [Candidatus Omnitrophota bacterium]
MKKITLTQIKEGSKARIIEISGGHNLIDRLMNMGVYKGKEVTKLSHIGLRGPVVIKAGRSILALGHGVAAKIIVEAE